VTLKGLPLAYNKDMQEDKEPAFDAIDTLADSLHAIAGMVETMRVNADAMATGARGGFMAATDLADYLVGTGMAFREAHEVVGRLVLACEREGRTLQDLSAEEFTAHASEFGEGVLEAVDIEKVVARRITHGGTGHGAVTAQLVDTRDALAADDAWLESVLD
jgi:argininosuccinate lyase